VMLKEDLGELG